jgi:hypothetical protein
MTIFSRMAFFFESSILKYQVGQRSVFLFAFLARAHVPILAGCTQKNYKINPPYRTIED